MFNPGMSVKIIDTLQNAGFSAEWVGGCVRDYVMGREPHDYDIATSATPEQMIDLLSPVAKEIIPTGIKHGTITVVMKDGASYEVTTYRIDGKYSDGRHPDDVTFTASLEEDLARRDFTINAMAMRWPSMDIVDPYNGYHDCAFGVIHCVGNADERFREDPLRMLRAFRFMAQLGWDCIDADTLTAMWNNAPLIKTVSKERISSELTKMMQGDPDVFLYEYYLLLEIIPEMNPLMNFCQNNPYHAYDVYGHTRLALQALQNEAPKHPEFDKVVVSLALLLHDTGKPESYTEEIKEDGEIRGHFYGHEERSEEIARTVLTRLRFPTKVVNDVCELILAHNATILPKEKLIRRLMNKHGVIQTRHLLYLNLCDTLGRGSGTLRWDECVQEAREAIELFEDMLTRPQTFSVKDLAINGHDLLNMGVPQGKMIGQILDQCLAKVIDDKIPNDKESLLYEAGRIAEYLMLVHDQCCCICKHFAWFMGSAGICNANDGCACTRMRDYMDVCNCDKFEEQLIQQPEETESL